MSLLKNSSQVTRYLKSLRLRETAAGLQLQRVKARLLPND